MARLNLAADVRTAERPASDVPRDDVRLDGRRATEIQAGWRIDVSFGRG
jgi:hypothetical protein